MFNWQVENAMHAPLCQIIAGSDGRNGMVPTDGTFLRDFARHQQDLASPRVFASVRRLEVMAKNKGGADPDVLEARSGPDDQVANIQIGSVPNRALPAPRTEVRIASTPIRIFA